MLCGSPYSPEATTVQISDSIGYFSYFELDEIIKQAEDAAKDEERIIKDKYSKINKAIEKSEGNLKDY